MSASVTCPICFLGDMVGGADDFGEVRETADSLHRHGWIDPAQLATVHRILTDMERERMAGILGPARRN